MGGCCCQLLDLSVSGNFSDENVWNNAYFQQMRKRFIDPEFPLLEPCTWCYNNSTHKGDLLSIIKQNPLFRVVHPISQRLWK